jgi:hypothetical protein
MGKRRDIHIHIHDAGFNESDHPRKETGEFTAGGGGSSGGKSAPGKSATKEEATTKYTKIADPELIDNLTGILMALEDKYSDAAGFDFKEAEKDIGSLHKEITAMTEKATDVYRAMSRTEKKAAPNAVKLKDNLREVCELLKYAQKSAKKEEGEDVSALVEEARGWMETNQELMGGKFE